MHDSVIENAMVSANWLYSCPVIPGMSAAGMNTASSTKLVATIGPVTCAIAFSAASCMSVTPFSSWW